MPRRSSARSAPRAAPRRAPVHNPPQHASNAPPPAPAQSSGGSSMLGGIGSTIAQGMAFGTGSAVAHRAVDGVLGPRAMQHEYVSSDSSSPQSVSPSGANTNGMEACANQMKTFQDCLNNYGSDISKCQFYLDMLNECRKGSTRMNF
eukprot:TRINITY_DN31781_c0_g1_i1.p1 TRINITY_DN31781_c0_g1~~TRINITY_DN31781_c0_g1_i1.p1  ORF type:complete len:147 (-),score=36.67 TRINITY_DN31781_c0_g1_i1:121-561(-)